MKKGATKKIESKKKSKKSVKRAAEKKKADSKKKAQTKKRALSKKPQKRSRATNKKAKGETIKNNKKAQMSKKVEIIKSENARSQRMANRSVRVKAQPTQDLKRKEGVHSKPKTESMSQP